MVKDLKLPVNANPEKVGASFPNLNFDVKSLGFVFNLSVFVSFLFSFLLLFYLLDKTCLGKV